jgi:acetyl-CoA carboxylase biotin carboxyl carrier protein
VREGGPGAPFVVCAAAAQELGRLPWLAELFFRAFFLRAFFAMVIPFSAARLSAPMLVVREVCPRSGPDRDGIPFMHRADEEGHIAMAEEIRAEMVANVWKVVATAGDSVEEGDTLVILESMKMEIPVVVETAGVLAQLAVNEGDVVQEGDLIAVIED